MSEAIIEKVFENMSSDSDAKPFASRLEKVKSIYVAWDKGDIDSYDAMHEILKAIDLMEDEPS